MNSISLYNAIKHALLFYDVSECTRMTTRRRLCQWVYTIKIHPSVLV